ncbi:MAG TPA: hypothetical protein VHB47_20765 [Thermoanaerobaculia bacterium]|jgi:hypothetical protein|nr:hypothetical protein [Thermoanaerobaculia bacterium]
MAGESRQSRQGRPPHEIETAEFKITTTKVVLEDLKKLVGTGYFGKSYNEAAEQLLRAQLHELRGSAAFGRLLRREIKPRSD